MALPPSGRAKDPRLPIGADRLVCVGERYNLSGPQGSLDEAEAIAARLGGHRLPWLHIPDGALRVLAPLGRLMGQPNLRELVTASSNVTYLFSPAKAERELDFSARDLETGLRDTFGGA